MYAIIKTGGKQYRVSKDDVIDVDLLSIEDGKPVEFKEILFLHDGKNAKMGNPGIAGTVVTAEVVGTVYGPKIDTMKYKRSHNQYRRFGHRQRYSRVKITGIESKGERREKK